MTRRAIGRELSLWADFNSVDDRRRIKTSLRFADTSARPFEGEWVRLHDDEGNSVMGVVEEIHGLIVHVRPEMATWTATEINIKEPFATRGSFRAVPQGKPIGG